MLLITLSCTKDQNLPLIFFQYTPSHTFWQGMAWCSCFVTLALALHPFIFWSHSLIPSSFIFVSKPQLWSLCCFNWRHLHFSACLERSTHQGQAQCLKPTSCIWSHLLLTTNLYVNLPWCTPPHDICSDAAHLLFDVVPLFKAQMALSAAPTTSAWMEYSNGVGDDNSLNKMDPSCQSAP